MKRFWPVAKITVVTILLPGCPLMQNMSDVLSQGHITTPHEAFIRRYSGFVGKKFDEVWWGGSVLNKKILPNGNIQVEIGSGPFYQRGCRVYYDYNARTKIIESFSYTPDDVNGAEKACVVNPYT